MNMEEMVQAIKNNDFCSELITPFRNRFFGESIGHATDNVVNFTKELLE